MSRRMMRDPLNRKPTEPSEVQDTGGPPCDEAQADGVPCEEVGGDCEDCDRADPERREDWARQD